MTTCVFDGKTLAADSRVCGDYLFDKANKIYKVGSLHYAICGRLSTAVAFVNWARKRTEQKPRLEDDFEILLIRDGKPYFIDHNYTEIPAPTPCAIGSGGCFAMAAMLCGKDARGAIEISKKLDESTGGKIKTVSIK